MRAPCASERVAGSARAAAPASEAPTKLRRLMVLKLIVASGLPARMRARPMCPEDWKCGATRDQAGLANSKETIATAEMPVKDFSPPRRDGFSILLFDETAKVIEIASYDAVSFALQMAG